MSEDNSEKHYFLASQTLPGWMPSLSFEENGMRAVLSFQHMTIREISQCTTASEEKTKEILDSLIDKNIVVEV